MGSISECYDRAATRARTILNTRIAQAEAAAEAIDILKSRKAFLEEARDFVSRVGIDTQTVVLGQIEAMVTLILQGVYGDHYAFRIEQAIKGGRPSTDMVVSKDGIVLDPATEMGGGILDMVSLGLRLSMWSYGDKTKAVMLMDEPFRFVGSPESDLVSRISELLVVIHEMTGMQFVIVSHNPELASSAHRVFEVRMVNGVSKVKMTDNRNSA